MLIMRNRAVDGSVSEQVPSVHGHRNLYNFEGIIQACLGGSWQLFDG